MDWSTAKNKPSGPILGLAGGTRCFNRVPLALLVIMDWSTAKNKPSGPILGLAGGSTPSRLTQRTPIRNPYSQALFATPIRNPYSQPLFATPIRNPYAQTLFASLDKVIERLRA